MSAVAASPLSDSLNKGHTATEVRNITHSREVSTKVGVYMSTQPIFIHLAHRPTQNARS